MTDTHCQILSFILLPIKKKTPYLDLQNEEEVKLGLLEQIQENNVTPKDLRLLPKKKNYTKS